ncbi:MAG TPA: methylmalonyl-CoA epimerase [Fibrobacteria bacterium]|nr:methylmalonyl-CoA epimerase [Fibrobacteria bacterium]
MIKKIDHLGIAVKSLEEAIPLWEKMLGTKCENIEEVASQKVRTAFLRVGEVYIELLEATAEDSPIAKYIEKNGEGVQHVAFRTDDIVAELSKVKGDGMRLIDEAPRAGAGGMDIAFLHPKSTRGVLTEFCAPAHN